MMKKLLRLALIAVASEATAEDAQCVRERAAMVETIRAYARSDSWSFGTTRHFGERPRGREANGTPSVHPWAFLLGGIRGQAGSHWPTRLARKVCTVEIIAPLAKAAAKVLRDLGYDNVSVKVGDGYHGWPECGPFDAIIVTAALGHVPPLLIEQLKVGGRLVMPLGAAHASQQLSVVEKIAPNETKTRSVIPVRFVPFTR